MKTDFEKAAKDIYPEWESDTYDALCVTAFLAGCEHAYSIDKETIERLEKEVKSLQEFEKNIIPMYEEQCEMIKELKAKIAEQRAELIECWNKSCDHCGC